MGTGDNRSVFGHSAAFPHSRETRLLCDYGLLLVFPKNTAIALPKYPRQDNAILDIALGIALSGLVKL
jgi:hypothetical protein